MREDNGRARLKEPRAHVQPTTTSVPRIVRSAVRRFGWRDVRRVAVIRWLVAIWLVALGSFFCVSGHWWGALLFVAAAVNGWLAVQMPRWRRALDALQNGPRVRELERTRALVVDDAAARLRRIEQDLHDGAQAQMVAVVMKLGLTREHLARVVVRRRPRRPRPSARTGRGCPSRSHGGNQRAPRPGARHLSAQRWTGGSGRPSLCLPPAATYRWRLSSILTIGRPLRSRRSPTSVSPNCSPTSRSTAALGGVVVNVTHAARPGVATGQRRWRRRRLHPARRGSGRTRGASDGCRWHATSRQSRRRSDRGRRRPSLTRLAESRPQCASSSPKTPQSFAPVWSRFWPIADTRSLPPWAALTSCWMP